MYGYPCVLACFHLNAPENSSPRRDSEVFGFQLPHIWNYLLSSCITRIPIVTERHHIYHDLIFPPPKSSCRYFVRYRGVFFFFLSVMAARRSDGRWIPMQSKAAGQAGPAVVVYSEVPGGESGGAASTPQESSQQSWIQKWFGGVRLTLRWFTFVAVVVLVTNVAWLFDARSKYGIRDGFGIIKRGPCAEIMSLDTWLHLLINVLSTMLLAGSNAFMAVFSCPSRKEVDKAHRRGKFLRVGSISLGNLTAIAKRKGFVVFVLAMSSVPFHLL